MLPNFTSYGIIHVEMDTLNTCELKSEASRLTPEKQASVAQIMSTQALLSALYDKSVNIDDVRWDFKSGHHSLLSMFDERARLRVLVERFGEMVLAITDAQFENGERNNGWNEISQSHMRDIVIQSMMTSLHNAMQIRIQTKKSEQEGRG